MRSGQSIHQVRQIRKNKNTKVLLTQHNASDDVCGFVAASMPAHSTYSVLNHQYGEFVYTFDGITEVNVEHEHFIAPINHGVWIPPKAQHECLSRYAINYCSLHIASHQCNMLPSLPCILETNALNRAILRHLTLSPPTLPLSAEYQRLFDVFIDQLQTMKIHSNFLPLPKDNLLLQLVNLIENHTNTNISINVMAKNLGLTTRTLNRKSHRELGMPFAEWCRRFKIVKAMRLLDQGYKVEAVAFELGYSSASAFITMFRKVTGKIPRGKT